MEVHQALQLPIQVLKLAGLEKEGGGWLEPAKAFLSQCVAIGSVAGQANPAAQRAFLRTVGSNLAVSNRTLCVSYKLPFSFLAENGSRSKELPGQDSNLGHADYDLPSLPRG